MEIVVSAGAPRPMTEKDAKLIAGPRKPGQATAEILSVDAALARVAALHSAFDIALVALAAALLASGLYYWENAEESFEKSEFLPFPFVLAALCLGAILWFRRRRRSHPPNFDLEALGLPPAGKVSVSDEGLTIGAQTYPWRDVVCTRIGVVRRRDAEGPTDFLIQWAMIEADGTSLKLHSSLMSGGQPILNAIYRRCANAAK